MKARIESLGRIKSEFPPRGNLQVFQLEKPATFVCAVRKVEVTSAKVALNFKTGELLSNGAYSQLLARALTKCAELTAAAVPRCIGATSTREDPLTCLRRA